jgi:hypothetical protein
MMEHRDDAFADAGAATVDQPVGPMGLLPTVVFGVRASALARVALPIAVVTGTLAGAGPAVAVHGQMLDTTCCPPHFHVVDTSPDGAPTPRDLRHLAPPDDPRR